MRQSAVKKGLGIAKTGWWLRRVNGAVAGWLSAELTNAQRCLFQAKWRHQDDQGRSEALLPVLCATGVMGRPAMRGDSPQACPASGCLAAATVCTASSSSPLASPHTQILCNSFSRLAAVLDQHLTTLLYFNAAPLAPSLSGSIAQNVVAQWVGNVGGV